MSHRATPATAGGGVVGKSPGKSSLAASLANRRDQLSQQSPEGQAASRIQAAWRGQQGRRLGAAVGRLKAASAAWRVAHFKARIKRASLSPVLHYPR